MTHVPGKIHVGPDTLSRKEVTQTMVAMFSDNRELIAMIGEEEGKHNIDLMIEAPVAANIPTPVTWQQIRDKVSKDKIMTILCDQISDGFPPNKKLLRLELREFLQHRDHLTQGGWLRKDDSQEQEVPEKDHSLLHDQAHKRQ